MKWSVVELSSLNNEIRIDAEYHHPFILSNLDKLSSKNSDLLENLVEFVVGPFGSTVTVDKYVENSDYRYIRNKDINDFVIIENEPALIPEEVYKPLTPFHIQERDLLITVVGTLGKVAIAQKKDTTSIFSCKSTILRANKVNPYYLLTYLNASTGQLFSLRGKRGAIQEGLNVSDLKEINVFLPNTDFQKYIETMIKTAFLLKEKSKKSYSQVQTLLLKELDLINWQPKHQLSYVKTFSDTQTAERFDAEYFQPKYEEVIEKIKGYSGGFSYIYDQFKQNKKTFKKVDGDMYSYVEIGCLNTSDGDISPLQTLGKDLPANAKIKLFKNDVLVSKVRPYRGAIGIVNKDDFVGSGAFAVLQQRGVLEKETLMMFLRLPSMLDFALKFNTGTSYPTITDEDILNFPVPLFKPEIQNMIKELSASIHEQKLKSKSLLEMAKTGVEKAIETTEEDAIRWMATEIDKLDVSLELTN